MRASASEPCRACSVAMPASATRCAIVCSSPPPTRLRPRCEKAHSAGNFPRFRRAAGHLLRRAVRTAAVQGAGPAAADQRPPRRALQRRVTEPGRVPCSWNFHGSPRWKRSSSFPSRSPSLEARALVQAPYPTVLVDTWGKGLPSVTIDDRFGGGIATRHLIDLGHRRIGFVGEPADNPSGSCPVPGARRVTCRRSRPRASPPTPPSSATARTCGRPRGR